MTKVENEDILLQPLQPTTTYYTEQSWGFHWREHNVYAEQIDTDCYIYNADGKLGIADVQSEKDDKGKLKRKYLIIKDREYELPKKIWDVSAFYKPPSIDECTQFIHGEYKVRDISEILNDFEKIVSTLFDFVSERDLHLWKLFIVQSYLKPILDNFFFMGVDATKGAGKTTLLEIMSYVARHGFFGGDMSPSSLPRMVEHLDLALFVNELDQKIGKGEEDVTSILRKGQRRGNVYVRLNKHTLHPEKFDVAGSHAFSFRGQCEDAFMSRTLNVHTAETVDKRLPIINIYKNTLLQNIKKELFFWGILNVPSCYKSLQQIKQSLRLDDNDFSATVVSCSDCSGKYEDHDLWEIRKQLHKKILKDFTEDELNVFDELTGRNIELAYLLLSISKLVGLDVSDIVNTFMREKQEAEEVGENIYRDILSETLFNAYNNLPQVWLLKEGQNAGCYYTTKSAVYSQFSTTLKDKNIGDYGPRKFASLLKDIGFLKGVSWTNQRTPDTKQPRDCLIFSKDIKVRLGISELTDFKEEE